MALAALAVGVVGIVDVSGAPVAGSTYPAVVVGVVGVMLLVGAFYGRAGGLILVGLLATACARPSALGAEKWDGERVEIVPDSSSEVLSTYDYDVGEYVLDLTQARPTPRSSTAAPSRCPPTSASSPSSCPADMDVTVDGPSTARAGPPSSARSPAGSTHTATQSHDGGTDVPELDAGPRARRRPHRRPHPLTRPPDQENTMTTFDTEAPTAKRSGRHPINVGHFVMGIAFLGIVLVWILIEADAVTGDDIRWLLPVPWVLAGVAGLLATTRRKHPETETYDTPHRGWVGHEEPPAPVEEDHRDHVAVRRPGREARPGRARDPDRQPGRGGRSGRAGTRRPRRPGRSGRPRRPGRPGRSRRPSRSRRPTLTDNVVRIGAPSPPFV